MSQRFEFTTVRVGVALIRVAKQEIACSLQVLLDADGAYRLFGSALFGSEPSPPLASLAEALALAESAQNAGASPEVSWEISWRSDLLPVGPHEQPCPVCGAPSTFSQRYPRSLCPVCELEATDAAGRALRFGNVALSGGFRAWYADDGSSYADDVCYVRGVRCRAEEHHFGGIVLQPIER